jgi:hypothetical protein
MSKKELLATRKLISEIREQSAEGNDLTYNASNNSVLLKVSKGANVRILAATTSLAGVMSSADKIKLDNISSDVQSFDGGMY